ncbi:hypothetical protein [uncultured Paraglaciecola sp.]|uniref:hypothetical protein n=1 Tax=uncultured Paraglaciecola sp. TaxID=1765024 RepID=UPI00262BA694|nr:hypothetical protein [uncultured Paraglaciecola sp.]
MSIDKLKIIDDCIHIAKHGNDIDLSNLFEIERFFSRLADDLNTESPHYGKLHVKRNTIINRLRVYRKQVLSLGGKELHELNRHDDRSIGRVFAVIAGFILALLVIVMVAL